MNGVATAEDRANRKRILEADLQTVRSQKAEVLYAIQQISKKQKIGGPPSYNAQTSHEVKVNMEGRTHSEKKKQIWQMCAKIIQELLKNSNTKLYFGEPVHMDKYPGYYEVIKNPRDLGTIKKSLEAQLYSDVFAFRDDVRLCFENCRTFNPPGHNVRSYGDSASENFEKKWQSRRIEDEWNEELRRHKLAMERLELEVKPLPDKIKEVDEELQDLADKAATRTSSLPPGPGREMTFEEKRKLSHSLSQMGGEHMARVLEIVAEGPSFSDLEAAGEEFEMDVDTLDSDTLWKLQAYADVVTNELNAKAARPGAGAGGATPAAGTTEGGGEGTLCCVFLCMYSSLTKDVCCYTNASFYSFFHSFTTIHYWLYRHHT